MSLSAGELRWLSKAVQVAQGALHSKWRVGAVIVKNGRVLGYGSNRYRNNPARVELRGVSYHAEEVAIRRSGNVAGATIYVARVTKSGMIGLATPCIRCQNMLVEYNVSSVIWTEPMGWGRAKIQDLLEGSDGHRTECNSETHPLLS